MSNDVNEILKLIQQTKEESTYDVYIPSQGKSFPFMPLDANDQKELVRALVDSPLYSNEFNVKFANMIPTIASKELDCTKLTTFDKLCIALKVRQENVGDAYTVKAKNKAGDVIEKEISIKKHLESVGEIAHPENHVLKEGDYEVVVSIPNIVVDSRLEEYLATVSKKFKSRDEDSVKEMISHFYIANIARYISKIKIKDSEFDLEDDDTVSKLQVAGQLPAFITRKIVDVIDNQFGKCAEQLLKVSFTDKGEKLESVIIIDNTFFMT